MPNDVVFTVRTTQFRQTKASYTNELLSLEITAQVCQCLHYLHLLLFVSLFNVWLQQMNKGRWKAYIYQQISMHPKLPC